MNAILIIYWPAFLLAIIFAIVGIAWLMFFLAQRKGDRRLPEISIEGRKDDSGAAVMIMDSCDDD